MVKRTVLFDTYCWMTEDPKGHRGLAHNVASRGEEIEVSEVEASRGEALGALGSKADIVAAVAQADAKVAETWEPATDEAIEAFNLAQVHAYLNQVPEERRDDEVSRVIDLENLREKPRAGVLSLAE